MRPLRHVTLLACWFAAAVPFAPAPARAVSPLWAGLEPGPFAVGFQVLERRDPSRPFRHPLDLAGGRRSIDVARPMQIAVWYPAQPAGGTPMQLGDYVALMGGELDLSLPAAERAARGERAYFAFELLRPATTEQRRRLLATATEARRDAPPAAGRFPVILWSLGSPAVYQASAEHLASHGYVVAILPRLPPMLALADNSPTRPDYDAKSRDLDFLVGEVSRLPYADVGNLGVTGFSAGGRWAIAEAMRNPSVRAVVSQDSILLFADEAFESMSFYQPARVRIPVLHMVRREWVPRETSELWKAMRNAERTHVVFEDPELDHLDFASMGYAATLAGLRPELRETIARTYAGWQRATLWFFDAHLKGDAASRARVLDLRASLDRPAGSVTVERIAGAGVAVDEQQLAEALVEDFAGALRKAREIFAAGGGTPELEAALNFSGYALLARGRAADAVAVFALNTEAFPASANAWDSLGDGYEATGEAAQAEAASRKAIDLLAGDTATPEARRELIRRSAEGRLGRLEAARAEVANRGG